MYLLIRKEHLAGPQFNSGLEDGDGKESRYHAMEMALVDTIPISLHICRNNSGS